MRNIPLRITNVQAACVVLFMWLLGSCTPPPFQFVLSDNYTRERFSGRDIGNHTIGVCPLLTRNGPVFGAKLPSSAVAEMIRKTRPDLLIHDADSIHAALSSRLPTATLQRYYRLLFEGEVVSVQTEDSLWNAVTTDYLLVVRMRHGMDIRTFNQRSKKRINLEAELWDRSAMETVWRITVIGTCSHVGYSDQQFLIEAMGRVAAALPPSAPAYDTKAW